jgi:hypothetical protein
MDNSNAQKMANRKVASRDFGSSSKQGEFMTGSARRWLFLTVCGLALCLNSLKTAADSSSSGEHFGLSSQNNYLEQPDPKHVGKLLWKMWAARMDAVSPEKTWQVTVHGVSGVLYDKGAASARFTAPLATGDSGTEVVVAYANATAQVVVSSLAPKGTWIHADKVIWSAVTNKGVATGHVVFHDGKSGMLARSPALAFDTKLDSIQTSEGYRGTLP